MQFFFLRTTIIVGPQFKDVNLALPEKEKLVGKNSQILLILLTPGFVVTVRSIGTLLPITSFILLA